VGIDDFAARLIGKVDRASVPAAGAPVKENSVCFLLHSGHRTVRMVAPADGVIRRSTRRWVRIRPSYTTTRTPKGGSSRCG